MKTKKVKAAGRFGARYGTLVRGKITVIEAKQTKKQTCPFCKKEKIKRLSTGIWECSRCGKKVASHAYYLSK